jgi:hypothetical protein
MVRNIKPDPYDGLSNDDWWFPDELDQSQPAETGVLSESQIRRFMHDGFVVVTGLWPTDTIDQATTEARELHPADQTGQQNLSAMPWTQRREHAPDAILNHMTIHPRALAAVAQLMDTALLDIRLSQSHVIAKFGTPMHPDDPEDERIMGDQDIHVDYGNNTLMVPAHTATPDAVACLCYYSDVDESGGATHFARALPGELTTYKSDQFNPPNFVLGTKNGSASSDTGPRSAENIKRCYDEERPVHYKPGTCILYRLDAWHRGTPVALGKVRHTHHHVWRHKSAEWINWQSLAPRMAAMPTRFLSELSVVQRTVLGFAAPGNSYWTAETIDSVSQRYPGMDMTPYIQAMG